MHTEFVEKIKHVHGIHITPFNNQGDIDWDLMGQNIEFLIKSGIKVIVTCGNTSEFYSLTLSEVKEITTFVVKVVNKRATVIAGVGYDLQTAITLASHAEEVGIDGLMLHQPVHPFVLEDGLTQYYTGVASGTNLPILLYVKGGNSTVKGLRDACKPSNIVGIKFAVPDIVLFTKCVLELSKDIVWICGIAEMWAPHFAMVGAQGFTSGLVNVAPEKSLAMFESLQNKNYNQALQIWEEIEPFEKLRSKHSDGNNVSVVKEAMEQLKLSNGIVRSPIHRLPLDESKEVTRILQKWGKL